MVAGARLPHTTLVSTGELAARLADPDWLVVDCRAELSDRDAGARAWQAGHIPGAIHADLERDLSAPVTPKTGRHPLPPIDAFVATLSRWGVTGGTQVIAYDAGNSAYAARLWWMLRYLGHDAVAVLDGGYAAWLEEGHPVSGASVDAPAGAVRRAAAAGDALRCSRRRDGPGARRAPRRLARRRTLRGQGGATRHRRRACAGRGEPAIHAESRRQEPISAEG